jgi:hypothetical protein
VTQSEDRSRRAPYTRLPANSGGGAGPTAGGERFWESEPFYDPFDQRPRLPLGPLVAGAVVLAAMGAGIWLAWLGSAPERAPSGRVLPAGPPPAERDESSLLPSSPSSRSPSAPPAVAVPGIPTFAPTPVTSPRPSPHRASPSAVRPHGAPAPHRSSGAPRPVTRGGGEDAPAPSAPAASAEDRQADPGDPADPLSAAHACRNIPSGDWRHTACVRAWQDYRHRLGLD